MRSILKFLLAEMTEALWQKDERLAALKRQKEFLAPFRANVITLENKLHS